MGAAADLGVVGALTFDLQRFADGERTEPATPRRRQEARRRGQVARSPEVGLALVVLAGALILRPTVHRIAADLVPMAEGMWGSTEWSARELTPDGLRHLVLGALVPLRGVLWVLLAVAVIGLASQLGQVGILASTTPLSPQLERINPLAGLRRLFSARAVVELVKSLAKAAVIGWSAYGFIRELLLRSGDLVTMPPLAAAALVGDLALAQLLRMGLVLLAIAAADFAYQRWDFEQNLRMSRHEVMDEFKQTEGDPHVRARLRSRMRQILQQRMMHRLAQATVVVTNPTHVAVALRYEPAEMEAPVVVAKGQELLARRILERAQEYGVPVVQNPPLARALFDAVEVGRAIPPELYRAVAEVLAFVFRLGRQRATARQWRMGEI